MNKSMLVGAVVGVAAATAVAGFAGYSMMDRDDSEVVAAREHCYDVQVESAVEPKDDRRIAGTVIGGLIGGAVGKDVGDSDVTTVAGAAVGAIAGNQAQKKLQDGRTTTTTERHCDPVN